jgi:hypothetical protein
MRTSAVIAALAAALAVFPCAAETQPKAQAPAPAPAPARTPTQESVAILAAACVDDVGDPGATRRWAGKAGIPGRKDEIARMGHGVTDMWRLMTPAGAKLLLVLTRDGTCQVLATQLDAEEAGRLVGYNFHAKLWGMSNGPEPKRRFYKLDYRGATMLVAVTGAADRNALGSMVVYSEAALKRSGMWDQLNGKKK